MSIGTGKQLTAMKTAGGIVAPVSISSSWETLVDAGTLNTADNGGSAITQASAQVTRAGTHPASFAQFGGTYVAARIKYPVGMTITTQPQVSFRGRSGNQDWEQRKNIAGSDVVTITLNPSTDEKSADGAYQYSYMDPTAHLWDRVGCDEMLPCIVVAPAGTGGAGMALATLEGKTL